MLDKLKKVLGWGAYVTLIFSALRLVIDGIEAIQGNKPKEI